MIAFPEHLAERLRPLSDEAVRRDGDFVVYWMRAALRGDENPALDVAILAGRELGLPVFVYQGLSERYPYASDRHHTFILEGAKDVAAALDERGVGYTFHLERRGHRGSHLKKLAERAALVVTEEFPVEPWRTWTERLAAASPAPVWAVDASCVVPMRLAGEAYGRAYEYRRATAGLRAERLRRPWPENAPQGEPAGGPLVPSGLPFEPVDLAAADLAALVAECEIDHTVGPIPDTPGGSTAGYARWRRFVDGGGLAAYAGKRNDPLADGVSRLSPYLHYGMVSPFRIARQAAGHDGKGAAKFLDELLVWREMSWTWCHHRRQHATLAALPDWARQTLERHAADPRPAVYSWETLARAASGDPLWDAAQRSLLVHGELHNNVRMTWGKAFLGWTADPQTALDLAIDLNHRYALDGRDPNSYGGILWCFGAFDRPFKPEKPVLGSVRPRPTERHAQRLDVERYAAKTGVSALDRIGRTPPRVGVVGAGVSGLTLARTLADQGWPVTVVDKGRTPGGRLATRRGERATWDHGAQYFTARDPDFARLVDSWRQDGLVAEWQGRFVALAAGEVEVAGAADRRWVGVPGMSAVGRHLARTFLAAGGELHTSWRAKELERRDGRWWIVGQRHQAGGRHAAEAGPFDLVVTALPAAQAAPLLAAGSPALAEHAEAAHLAPCCALLLTYDAPLGLPYDAAFVNDNPLSWIARNASKPGRGDSESWVLHASPGWSAAHLEEDESEITPALLAAFAEVTARDLPEPAHATYHRWRYALPDPPLAEPFLFAPEANLAACGDWCGGPRVEGAYLSGAALAGRLMGSASRPSPR